MSEQENAQQQFLALPREEQVKLWSNAIDANDVAGVDWMIETLPTIVNEGPKGFSGLHRAVTRRHFDIFTSILQAPAIELADQDSLGNSSLHAVSYEPESRYLAAYLARARQLQEADPGYRFNINQANAQKYTGLIHAVGRNLPENVRLIADFPGVNFMHRFSLRYPGPQQITARDFAEHHGHWEIEEILRTKMGLPESGARPSQARFFAQISAAAAASAECAGPRPL